MIVKPVKWRDYFIIEVKVYDESDWKGDLPPSPRDFENVHAYQAIESLKRALDNIPWCPSKEEREHPKPWPQTVLELICKELLGKNDREFVEKVMQTYLDRYGMNQIIKAFGVNENDLKQKLDNMTNS